MAAQRAQHLVADRVAVGVVDALEVVEVDQRHAPVLLAALEPHALVLQQLLHVAAVDQAGEVVVRGQAMDVGQRGPELDLLAAQAVAHAVQAHGQRADAGHHDAQHDEVHHLAAERIALRAVLRHQRHHDAEHRQHVDADPDDLAAGQAEHAEHQDDGQDQADDHVRGAGERIGPRGAQHRVKHLLDGHRRIGETLVEAAADHDHHGQHAGQRGRRPPPQRPVVHQPERRGGVQHEHAAEQQHAREPGLRES